MSFKQKISIYLHSVNNTNKPRIQRFNIININLIEHTYIYKYSFHRELVSPYRVKLKISYIGKFLTHVQDNRETELHRPGWNKINFLKFRCHMSLSASFKDLRHPVSVFDDPVFTISPSASFNSSSAFSPNKYIYYPARYICV